MNQTAELPPSLHFAYIVAYLRTLLTIAAAVGMPIALAVGGLREEAVTYSIFASVIFPTWIVIGYAWRYLMPLFVSAFVLIAKTDNGHPAFNHDGIAAITSSLLLVVCLGAWKLSRRFDESAATELTWPFAKGTFVCFAGGSFALLNHHAKARAQRYACDFVRVNRFGLRASGLLPRRLDRYNTYDTSVLSPCAGTIIAAVCDECDQDIGGRCGAGDRRSPFGNHVAIRFDDVVVVLAHLRRGSVVVDVGMVVQSGDRLASVGNSGKSSEPHLHIHVERNGLGVPMTFAGRFLVRNDIMRVGP